jgi:hypothetical protein
MQWHEKHYEQIEYKGNIIALNAGLLLMTHSSPACLREKKYWTATSRNKLSGD